MHGATIKIRLHLVGTMKGVLRYKKCMEWTTLTLIPLTWRIWWAPNNASKWQMGFSWKFKGL